MLNIIYINLLAGYELTLWFSKYAKYLRTSKDIHLIQVRWELTSLSHRSCLGQRILKFRG